MEWHLATIGALDVVHTAIEVHDIHLELLDGKKRGRDSRRHEKTLGQVGTQLHSLVLLMLRTLSPG